MMVKVSIMFELLAQFGRCSMVPQLQKQHTETQVYSEENDETPWSLATTCPKTACGEIKTC